MASELKPCEIADALEKCDWAGASIGNKAIVSLAIGALRNTRPAPAATDTGLVTVGWATDYGGRLGTACFDEKLLDDFKLMWSGNLCELVTRSQAEQLLAAERAEKEEARRAEEEAKDCFWSIYETHLEKGGLPVSTEGARSALSNRIASLEADNAALTARVKELEDRLEFDPGGGDRIDALESALEFSRHGRECLEAKLAAAEELLRQSRLSLKRAPFNLLVGIDDFLAESKARVVLGGKPS